MAIVWQKHIDGDLYQVRNAGKTLRLYTNDVFHTQYNPDQPLTGHVWDLLMLPAFFHLHRADAVRWIKNYNGEKFDLIIEDLFREQDGHPVPVMPANRAWFELLLRHVSGDGMIVRNFIDQHELKTCAALTNRAVNSRFKSIYQLTSFFKENYVGAFARSELSSQQLRKRLIATPGLNPALKTSRLRYSLRRLS